MPTTDTIRKQLSQPLGSDVVFAITWAITFFLYLPAAKAGFVADFTGWLDQTIRYGFLDNINRTHYHVQSLYQFTQLNTWLFYQVAGTHPWPWHLLFVSLHAANCALLYRLCLRLLADSSVAGAATIAISGTLFFCITPSASEVVVWEPSFHYLQGMFILLLILNWAQRFAQTGKPKYALYSGIAYLLSTFSLEIFYITPWLVLCMGAFYRLNDSFSKKVLAGIIKLFVLPQLLMFALHLVIFRLYYGTWVAHIATTAVSSAFQEGMGKPAKHLFHTLVLGRFMSDNARHIIYDFFDSVPGIIVCYAAILAILFVIVRRYIYFKGKARVATLLFIWTIITLALLIPIWFGNSMLIVYDRYTYFTNAFVFMQVAIGLSFINITWLRLSLTAAYALINIRYTIQVSRYWMKSDRVITALIKTFPYQTDKKVVLLNLPQTMHGAAMIGAEPESEFKMMYNGLMPAKQISTTVYDGMAYNMLTPGDGAHVKVLTDSTIEVVLNQWGTWWWYSMRGGQSYSNDDYSIDMKDVGHTYQITLKHPPSQYLLLYQQGQQWKTVDMSKKDVEQN